MIKDVYDGYLTFQQAWSSDRIRKNPEHFVKQTQFIVKALHDSTLREEQELYDRVDAAFEQLEDAS